MQKEEEVKHSQEKLEDAQHEIRNLEVSACTYMRVDRDIL